MFERRQARPYRPLRRKHRATNIKLLSKRKRTVRRRCFVSFLAFWVSRLAIQISGGRSAQWQRRPAQREENQGEQ